MFPRCRKPTNRAPIVKIFSVIMKDCGRKFVKMMKSSPLFLNNKEIAFKTREKEEKSFCLIRAEGKHFSLFQKKCL